MRAVKGKDTGPEMIVRRLVYALGFRYRIHGSDLPGKPDLVFPGRRKALFVHGCFWHGHDCKRGARLPATNVGYWSAKITRNRARDRAAIIELERRGWAVLTVWECEMKDGLALSRRLKSFLGETAT